MESVSTVSYTEKWRFLMLKGSFLPWKTSNIYGRRAWGPLQVVGTESYTINNNAPPKGHLIRPLPMKICPPNYYLNGVEAHLTESGVWNYGS